MSQAKDGDTVKVHYTGNLDDGMVFGTSTNLEPIQFTIGEGQVIPGIEQAVIGMNPGESKIIKIPAGEAFGPRHEEMVLVVERNQFPEHLNPEVGKQFQIPTVDGKSTVFTVTDVSEFNVTLDANHPLAGKDLTFDIQLIEIA
jgi:peptidylprolyl isomerase